MAHNRAERAIHKISTYYKVSIAKNSNYFYPGDKAWLSHLSASIMQYFQDDYVWKKVIRHCDFMGVNYYNSHRIYGYKIHDDNKLVSDLNWDMRPADIKDVLIRLYDKYDKPIFITENGLADSQDKNRKWWILQTIVAMKKAMDKGVKVIGYLHWSLIDNFEWSYGKWPRFGLIEIDYKTGTRKPRPSAVWYGKIIKKIREI